MIILVRYMLSVNLLILNSELLLGILIVANDLRTKGILGTKVYAASAIPT